MYLEFITDVTNEILAQGIYSDRCVTLLHFKSYDVQFHTLSVMNLM